MCSLLHLLRLFLACGLLLPAGAPERADQARGVCGTFRGNGPVCAEIAGESRLAVTASRLPEDAGAPSSGHGDPGRSARPIAAARSGDLRGCGLRVVRGALLHGELPASQAFLRGNGASNAHGARA